MKQTRSLKFLFPLILISLVGLSFASARLLSATEGDILNVRDSKDAPIKLIFDTDIGSDIDDAFALALIHRFADRGVCELLGITLTNPNTVAARFVGALNAAYGRPEIPVGVKPQFDQDDSYSGRTLAQTLVDGTPEFPVPEGFKTEDPIKLLRSLLANSADGEVVVVQVGGSTNLAEFLDSPADEISELTGRELAAKKVRLLSVMGGAFAIDEQIGAEFKEHAEWNIYVDIPSAQRLALEWPTEIVFSGYEVGMNVLMSTVNLKTDYKSYRAKMIRDAYQHWTERNAPAEGMNHRRPTWDLTSVFFVVRPEEGRDYFTVSEPLDVRFDDKGKTLYEANPNGKHRVFLTTPISRARVEEAFVNLCSEP